MVSTRWQLRIVALFYMAVTIPILTWFEVMRTAASSTQSGSIAEVIAQRAAHAFPSVAFTAVCYLALALLSFRFLVLSRSWRIATVAGSVIVCFLQIAISVRDSAVVIPNYMKLEPTPYGILAIELSVFWARALAFWLCSYVLWKTFRALGSGRDASESGTESRTMRATDVD